MWEISNKWGGGGKWGGKRGEDGGMGGAGDRGWGDLSPHHMVNICAAKRAWNPGKHTKSEFLGDELMGGACIGLESDRAGSRTL